MLVVAQRERIGIARRQRRFPGAYVCYLIAGGIAVMRFDPGATDQGDFVDMREVHATLERACGYRYRAALD